MTAHADLLMASLRRARHATAVLLTLAAGVALTGCSVIPSTSPVAEPDAFEAPLVIPPLAKSRLAEDGTRVFELTAQEGATTFAGGTRTETWGSTAPSSDRRSAQSGVSGSPSR